MGIKGSLSDLRLVVRSSLDSESSGGDFGGIYFEDLNLELIFGKAIRLLSSFKLFNFGLIGESGIVELFWEIP